MVSGAKAKQERRTAPTPRVHRIKISLYRSSPPIWRRLEVPSNTTLAALHNTIQAAFGWEHAHMWVFERGDDRYGVADRELGFHSAEAVRLSSVAARVDARLRYTYDFGDDWHHDIVVEEVHPAEPGVAYPRCLTGRRACPPEDCGGVWGYESLLEILRDPDHPHHEEMLEWMGLESPDEFDPAAFDVAATNVDLAPLASVLVAR